MRCVRLSYLAVAVLGVMMSPVATAADCPNSLDQPDAVVTVRASAVRPLLQDLAKIALNRGFAATGGVDWNGGHFKAAKAQGDKIQHRIAVWVQWNLHAPGEELDVYLFYGRYRRYTGGDWELEASDSQAEDRVVGELKRDILRLSGFRGQH